MVRDMHSTTLLPLVPARYLQGDGAAAVGLTDRQVQQGGRQQPGAAAAPALQAPAAAASGRLNSMLTGLLAAALVAC